MAISHAACTKWLAWELQKGDEGRLEKVSSATTTMVHFSRTSTSCISHNPQSFLSHILKTQLVSFLTIEYESRLFGGRWTRRSRLQGQILLEEHSAKKETAHGRSQVTLLMRL